MMLTDIETFSTGNEGKLFVAAATSSFFERPDLLQAEFMDDALLAALRRWHDDIIHYIQRGMETPDFQQRRTVHDSDGSGKSERAVHHFHGLVLEAYANAVA